MNGKPFVLLGVNTDEDRDEVRQLQQAGTITWRSWWNGPDGTRGPITEAWKVDAFPTLVLIDQAGVIRYRFDGAPGPSELETKLIELLKEVK